MSSDRKVACNPLLLLHSRVGIHTFSGLNVRKFCDVAGENLQIGNSVSIADDVIFILDGQHQT